MSNRIEIAPSMLSADFARLGEEIRAIEDAGADLIHLDIMDGHFVPNITFGPVVVKSLRSYTRLPFDVHLMIHPADCYIESFCRAGADILTVHPESNAHIHRTIQLIKFFGVKAGLALNPGTPAETVENLMADLDQILVMTVNPGFGGQNFISEQLKKIEQIRKMIDTNYPNIVLEVDGGINPETAEKVIAAGATRLVAGTSVFLGGSEKYKENITALKQES